jgi:hypothetical protein
VKLNPVPLIPNMTDRELYFYYVGIIHGVREVAGADRQAINVAVDIHSAAVKLHYELVERGEL